MGFDAALDDTLPVDRLRRPTHIDDAAFSPSLLACAAKTTTATNDCTGTATLSRGATEATARPSPTLA